MSVLQGSPSERNLYLTLADVPALGVSFSQVVCKFRKEGQGSLTTKTLDGTNWTEIGNGFYVLKFSGADMNTLGFFFFTLTSVQFDNFLYDEFTIEPVPSGSVDQNIPPDVCVVSGFIKNAAGGVSDRIRVTARPVEFPASFGTNILTGDTIYTYVGGTGEFQLNLVQGSTVILEIERTGIRAQITIPFAPTANLLDLLPPIPSLT